MGSKGILQSAFDRSAGGISKCESRISSMCEKQFVKEEKTGVTFRGYSSLFIKVLGMRILEAPLIGVRETSKGLAKIMRRPLNTR